MHAVDATVRAEMEWYTCAFSGLTKRDHAAVVMQLLNNFCKSAQSYYSQKCYF